MRLNVTTNQNNSSSSNSSSTTTNTTTATTTTVVASPNPKPLSSSSTRNTTIPFLPINPNSTTNTTTTTGNNSTHHVVYEPNSVLDLQRSPSPAASTTALQQPQPPPPPVSSTVTNPSVDLDNLEGWDSILTELGLNDDSGPNAKIISQFADPQQHHHHLPDFPVGTHVHQTSFDQSQGSAIIPSDFFSAADQFPYNNNNHHPNPNPNLNPNNNNFAPLDQSNGNTNYPPTYNSNSNGNGLDSIDDLIRAAQLLEANDTHQYQLILARLNQRLRFPVGKPLLRSAFYFKEALSSAGLNRAPPRLSSYEIVQTIRAHKAYAGISPIPLFSTFTANQAILEAIEGSSFVHIVDFDIGFGGHWASLMREIVDKSSADPSRSIVLRITAVVTEEFAVESRLVRENLAQFARDLSIVNFQIDFVLTRTFEILSFKAVKFVPGEKIAVHLSPATLQRLGSRGNVSKFIGDMRGLSANVVVVVVVDREVGMDTGTASFSVNFVAGLEFYTAVLESIDAAVAGAGGVGASGGSDWARRIETYLMRPRIVAAVEAAGRKGGGIPGIGIGIGIGWREAFLGYGMKAVGFSQFADFQAECLLRRAQVGGFHVAKRQGEMLLYWHDKPLVATSAWRC